MKSSQWLLLSLCRFHTGAAAASTAPIRRAATPAVGVGEGNGQCLLYTARPHLMRRLSTGGGLPKHRAPASSASLNIPTAAFAPPQSLTHEHLAYAHCPVCRRNLHMCDMYLHLTSQHKELNPKHCQRICHERLELYRETVGSPLVRVGAESTGASSSDPGGRAAEGHSSRTTSLDERHARGTLSQSEWLAAFLPTAVDGGRGGFICNWCERRDVVHATRDVFLKHVGKAHPELDLDEVEAKIPVVQKSSGSTGKHQAHNRSPTMATPPTPKRRLANVVTGVAEAAVSMPPPPPPTLSSKTLQMKNASVVDQDDIACELCGKVYTTELFLLQHMENAHPLGELASSPHAAVSSERSLAVADIARVQQLEMMGGSLPANYSAKCEFCPPIIQKTYNRPSALFSHMRMKHPDVDAEAALSRAATIKRIECPQCRKIFSTTAALDSHYREKHAGGTVTLSRTGLKLIDLSGCAWWCNDCEKGFSIARGLHGHLVTKHGLPSEVHPCPACKRVFADSFSLKEHIEGSHKTLDSSAVQGAQQSSWQCGECERMFLSVAELDRHARKHGHKVQQKHTAASAEKSAALPTAGLPTDRVTSTSVASTNSTSSSTKGDTVSGSSASAAAPRVVSRRRFVSTNAKEDNPTNPISVADVTIV